MDVTSYLLGKQAGGGGGQPTLQEKEITITENGTTSVVADTGYDGLSEVEITTNVSGGGYEDYISSTAFSYQSTVASLIKKLPAIDFTGAEAVYQFSFYGCRNLTEIGGLINFHPTNCNSMFNECEKLTSIPSFDTSNVTNMSNMFSGCCSITTIPQINTSNVTNMSYMFNTSYTEGQYGGPLTDIPILDTNKVSNMDNMFSARYYLNDTTLDNILQMCINATSYNRTKTLRQIGINNATYYPASRIQALPHYQDFINAGWTIGY
jgi:surface protein